MDFTDSLAQNSNSQSFCLEALWKPTIRNNKKELQSSDEESLAAKFRMFATDWFWFKNCRRLNTKTRFSKRTSFASNCLGWIETKTH